MDQDNYINLIYKKLKGELSAEERVELNAWMKASKANKALALQVEKTWKWSKSYTPKLKVDLDEEFQLLEKRILTEAPAEKKQAKVKKLNIRPILSWAAALALLVSAAWWFWQNNTATTDWQTLQTVTAELKEVTLKDGTKIWLNQESRLEYPNQFAKNERLVKLVGEAYFEVAKKEDQPFIIETMNAHVEVLGTSFNLRAYPQEVLTELTVKTGKVQFQPRKSDKKLLLTAKEKGVFNRQDNSLIESEHQNLNDLAWQSQTIVFEQTPINNVIDILKKQFGISIEVSNKAMLNCPLDGRYINLSPKEIIRDIATTFSMEWKEVDQQHFQLTGGTCE